MDTQRICRLCDQVLAPDAHASAVYCGSRCRERAKNSRRAARSGKVGVSEADYVDPGPALEALDLPVDMSLRARWVRWDIDLGRAVSVYGGKSLWRPSSWDWVSLEKARQAVAGDCLGFALTESDSVMCVQVSEQLFPLVPATTYVENVRPGWVSVFGLGSSGRNVVGDGFRVMSRGMYVPVSGRRWRNAPVMLTDITEFVDELGEGQVFHA